MPDSWIDPGNLQGDRLNGWYLRSPHEIEKERQAAAARRYQDFFYGPAASNPDPGSDGGTSAPDRDTTDGFAPSVPPTSQDVDPGFTWVAAGPNRWRSVRIEQDDQSPDPTSAGLKSFDGPMGAPERGYGIVVDAPPTSQPGPRGQFVQQAAASPGFWDYWSPRGCANCHGYTPGTLPPVGGQSPLPPNYSPRSGGASGQGGSQPDRRDKKECEQQLESDSQICGRLPRREDVAICRGTASERYAYCRRPDGTIGFPRLETKGGRRP